MSTLFESKSEANDLPPEEQEQQRLIEIFNGQFPEPQNLSSTDRAYVLRYLNNTNLLTFRTTGLERFLANTGVLPDGRVICTIHSTSSDHRLFPVGWGNKFGSCLRLALRTNKAPIQAVFIPGDTEFEALQSSQTIILAFVRLDRLQTLWGIDLTSSVELKSALLQLLALCALNHSEIEK